jgi:hypothetical protein
MLKLTLLTALLVVMVAVTAQIIPRKCPQGFYRRDDHRCHRSEMQPYGGGHGYQKAETRRAAQSSQSP